MKGIDTVLHSKSAIFILSNITESRAREIQPKPAGAGRHFVSRDDGGGDNSSGLPPPKKTSCRLTAREKEKTTISNIPTIRWKWGPLQRALKHVNNCRNYLKEKIIVIGTVLLCGIAVMPNVRLLHNDRKCILKKPSCEVQGACSSQCYWYWSQVITWMPNFKEIYFRFSWLYQVKNCFQHAYHVTVSAVLLV